MSDRNSPKNLEVENKPSGFMFIELLVVTMILGIIAVIGIVRSNDNLGDLTIEYL